MSPKYSVDYPLNKGKSMDIASPYTEDNLWIAVLMRLFPLFVVWFVYLILLYFISLIGLRTEALLLIA